MTDPASLPNISHAPIESWDVDKVVPYPKNNKLHSPKQVSALAKSIGNQGLNDPITVDRKGVIISGHGRLMAVKALGWTKVPVRHLHMLTEEQADKLRIAANKTASTDYDWENLQAEIHRLGGLGSTLDDIGFDEKELTMLYGDIGEIDLSTVSDDISKEVEDFEDAARESAETASGEEISLSKAFGISKLPLTSKKLATRFMAQIEGKTGLTGADALMKYMKDFVDGK